MGNVSNLAEAREARRLQKPRTNDGKGFALLHRKIMDVPFYKDAEAAHLWVHLLLRANHEQTLVSTDVGDVICERGEFITGRNTLAMETGLTADRVKSLLRKFQNLGMITTKSNNRFTVLKVVKYDEYQSNFCPADVQPVSSPNAVVPMPVEVECPADVQPVFTDERRNLIRTFWGKANKIARNLDGKPMDMDGFRSYLRYIAQNCRWMLEDRPDQKSGKTWRRMKFDKFLTEKLYIEVREGDRDDR